MTKVRITVGPRSYTINCAPEDEEKVVKFGQLIDENYAKLGNARAAQEADNLVFAALFMADELDEIKQVANDTRIELAGLRNELQSARDDAANAERKAKAQMEETRAKSGNGKAELRAEIETLRKAEERTRRENEKLKADLAEMQERARHQHDLFGGPASDAAHSDALAEKLEALALRAEKTATALEGDATAH